MAGFLDKFRREIFVTAFKNNAEEPQVKNIDDRIALGVLLWAVAEADDTFLPQEREKIGEILKTKSGISDDELSVVLTSVQKAADERIDLYRFTSEVSNNLDYPVRISIIEDLFRVACVDRELDENEVEVIRKISGLFHLSHKEFIDAKIKVKKEFGIETPGL